MFKQAVILAGGMEPDFWNRQSLFQPMIRAKKIPLLIHIIIT